MIPPIYIMAFVTTLTALAVWGTLLWQICPANRRRPVIGLLMLETVMSPAAFYGVRRPVLIRWLEPVLTRPDWEIGHWPVVRDLVRLCFAPLTEEPAKLLPWLLLLAVGLPLWPRRRMAAPLALAAGLGFAVGEIWLVATLVAQANDPKLAGLPWYAFGGFLGERLMTCVTHAMLAFPTIALARRGWRWAAIGLSLGIALHWLGNAPIALMHRRAFGWKAETWGALVQVWIILLTVCGLLILVGASVGRKMLRRVFSRRMRCPGCGAVYRQPLLYGFNFGMSRYERCGACGKWHWVTLKDLAPLAPISKS